MFVSLFPHGYQSQGTVGPIKETVGTFKAVAKCSSPELFPIKSFESEIRAIVMPMSFPACMTAAGFVFSCKELYMFSKRGFSDALPKSKNFAFAKCEPIYSIKDLKYSFGHRCEA